MSANPLSSILCSAALASGLVSAEAIEYAQRLARHRLAQAGEPNDTIPDKLLAEILVEQELLTQYQAEQLMQGRTKLSLGPYIVTDWIAQGGMGQVYKAVHKFMGRECAVKVLPLEKASGQVARKSFERETRVQARLDCPYLVRAFDAGVDGQIHYLVTEYVPGMDLRRLVKQQGPLPVHQAAHIIRQAALGLAYAHEKGLIHRDVKPGNILVTPQGDAKVSDLGLAGFNQDLLNDPRAGKIVGTTDYISPNKFVRRWKSNQWPTSIRWVAHCTGPCAARFRFKVVTRPLSCDVISKRRLGIRGASCLTYLKTSSISSLR